MPATPASSATDSGQAHPFVPHAQVSVTFTDDDGARHTLHGLYGPTVAVITTPGTAHAWHHKQVDPRMPSARQWVTIGSATGHALDHHGIPLQGHDYEFSLFGLRVCIDAETVSISALTDEGEEWVTKNSTPTRRIERLLERFATFDATAADLLRDAIDDEIREARDDEHFRTIHDYD